MNRIALQAGLILASLILHIWVVGGVVAVNFVLVFLGLISPYDAAEETELIVIPIELIELGEVNNIAPVIQPPEDEPEDDPVPPPPEDELPPEDVTEPEQPVDETLPEDEIEQTRPDTAQSEATPEDVVPDLDAEPDPTPEPEPEKEEPEPAPKANTPVERKTDEVDDFLNSIDSTFQSERETRKKQPEPRPQPKSVLEDTRPARQTPRAGAGERTGNSARLEALIYNYVRPCWDGVDDQPYPETLNVRMRLELDESGNIADLRLVDPSRRPIGNTPMGIAVDRALRAVRKCAPYKLPRDEYSEWRDIKVNLGPAFEKK